MRVSRQFVVACQLMSTIRHPRIVQFLGVCFFPDLRLPAILTERLLTNLHELLNPESEGEEQSNSSDNKPCLPLALKCSILHDVAQGLAFLHSRTPTLIHGDLSAQNVLLTAAMTAKIANLGVRAIVTSQRRAITVTTAPSASIYMPPEALQNESEYDSTVDIYSFGVLAIFVLSQIYPKPLSATYKDNFRQAVGRTELECCGSYMQKIESQLHKEHSLILMIRNCLKNLPQDRLMIPHAIEFLVQARREFQDEEVDMNRLELVHSLKIKTQLIQTKNKENHSFSKQVQSLRDQNHSLHEKNQSLSQQILGSAQIQQDPLHAQKETSHIWTQEKATEVWQENEQQRKQIKVRWEELILALISCKRLGKYVCTFLTFPHSPLSFSLYSFTLAPPSLPLRRPCTLIYQLKNHS